MDLGQHKYVIKDLKSRPFIFFYQHLKNYLSTTVMLLLFIIMTKKEVRILLISAAYLVQ